MVVEEASKLWFGVDGSGALVDLEFGAFGEIYGLGGLLGDSGDGYW